MYLLSYPFRRYRERKFDAAYDEYIRTNEGSRYFVYTYKRQTHEFIETEIIPHLGKDVKVVLLGGGYSSPDGAEFINRIVRMERAKGGYPWLIEISDGKPQAFSLNSAVYKAMKDGDAGGVLGMINS